MNPDTQGEGAPRGSHGAPRSTQDPSEEGPRARRRLVMGLAAVLTVLGIVGLLVAWTIQPVTLPGDWAPPEGDQDPMAAGPTTVPSTLRIPVVAGSDAISSFLESQVPRRFGDLGEVLTVAAVPGLTFAFEAERSPVESRMDGDRLSLRTEVTYEARGRWDSGFLPSLGGGCPVGAEPRPRMEVVLTVDPELTADWGLDADLELVSVRPVSEGPRDRCRLGGSSLDVTDALSALVEEELGRALPELRSQLQSLDVSGLLASHWSRLGDPISVGPEAWLSLGPRALALGGLSGENGAVRMDAEFTLHPRLLLMSERPVHGVAPVPAPSAREASGAGVGDPWDAGSEGQGNGGVSGAAEPGLAVEVIAGFDELSRALSEQLSGEVFAVAGREVELRSVEIWGLDDGRLVAEVALGRGFQGTLWAAGTPTLSSEGTLTIPDLEFLLSTRNPLAMLAARGFRSGLEAVLRDRIAWPSSQLLRDLGLPAGIPLEQELVPGIALEGTVDDISLRQVSVSAAGLRLTALAQLRSQVRVTSFR